MHVSILNMDEHLINGDTGSTYDVRIFISYSSAGHKMFHKCHCLLIAVCGVLSRVAVNRNVV
jgi:hypothetical protein